MDTSQIGLEHVQAKNFPYWKLYEGNRKVASCEQEENPEASPEVALNLFAAELVGREGKHDVLVYRNFKGESGGSRKTFVLPPIQTQRPMYGQQPIDTKSVYERARHELELEQGIKRIEEKLDLILLFIKERTDDDEGNDDKALKLIGSMIGGAMNKGKAAVQSIEFNRPVANSGAYNL